MFLLELILKNKIMLLIILIPIICVACYGAGYIIGANHSKYKMMNEQLEEKNKNLNDLIVTENKLIEDSTSKAESLESELNQQEINNVNLHQELKTNEALIDSTNHLDSNFMCLVQKSEPHRTIMPENATITNKFVSTNESSAPHRVLSYIADLNDHDAKCVSKYNSLLGIYDSQRQIINSFNK